MADSINKSANVRVILESDTKEAVSNIERLSRVTKQANKNAQELNDTLVDVYNNFSGMDGRKTRSAATVAKQAVDISNVLTQINEAGIKLANSLSKAAEGVYNSLQQWAAMDKWKVTKGVAAFDDTIKGFSDKMKDNIHGVDDDTLGYFDKFSGVIGALGSGATKFQDLDAATSVGNFNKFVVDATTSLKQFDQITPELISKLKSFGNGINESAKGLERFARMTDQEYQNAIAKSTHAQNVSFWNAYNNNKAAHAQTMKDNNMWFTNMFDKSKPFTQRLKESAKMLGGDMKNVFIGGLKGLITGGLFNLALKGLQTALKIIMTPVKTIVKMGTSFARLMIKTATGTEVFKKIIELTLLPFVLLFTLMFAPILVRLAPLLVDMVQKVTEKWDVLENIGDHIAEILTLFFDDSNWFSFGNILDSVISLLDDLTEVAYSTFKACQEAGETGLSAVVAIAASVIITFVDKIISFMYSKDGMYLFFAVGEIVGIILVEALKLAIAALAPVVVSVFGILGGMIGSALAQIIHNVAENLRNIWIIGGFLGDTLDSLSNDISRSSDSAALENSMYDKLSEAGIYNRGDTKINSVSTTSYMTINNNSFKPIGNIYTGKQYAMPGM